MNILELQVGNVELLLLSQVGLQSFTTNFRYKFNVGGNAYQVMNLVGQPDTTLHYDQATTFWVSFQSLLASEGYDSTPIPGHLVQVTRTVTVSLSQIVTDVNGNVTFVGAGTYDLTVTVEYSMNILSIDGVSPVGEPYFGSGAAIVSTDPTFGPLLESYVATFYPPTLIAFPLGTISLGAINAGVAVNQSQTFIAFRVELGQGEGNQFAAQGPWTEFYGGNITDHLTISGGLQPWSVFVTGDQVAGMVAQDVSNALAVNLDRFKPSTIPIGMWTPDSSGDAIVSVGFSGAVINGCPELRTDIDYELTGTVQFALVSPPSNILTTTTHLDWSGNQLQQVGCEIITAFSVSLLFGAVATPLGLGAATIAGQVGFMATFVVLISAYTFYTPTLSVPSQFSGSPGWSPNTAYGQGTIVIDANGNGELAIAAGKSGTHPIWSVTVGGNTSDGTVTWENVGNCTASGHDITCTMPIPVQLGSATLSFKGLFGASDGLILFGGLSFPVLEVVTATTSVGTFAWTAPAISCADVTPQTLEILKGSMSEVAIAVASVVLTVVGPGVLHTWNVTVTTKDPAGVLSPNAISIADYGSSSQIQLALQPNSEYAQNPYPFGLHDYNQRGRLFRSRAAGSNV